MTLPNYVKCFRRPYAASDADGIGQGRGVEHEVGGVHLAEVLHSDGEFFGSPLEDILLQSGWEAYSKDT